MMSDMVEKKRMPNREKAMQNFHKSSLPTRKKHPETEEYIHVELGDDTGELYPVWATKVKEIGARNFGLGIGLYFRTLLILSFVFFCLGLLNMYSMTYFKSSSYSGKSQDGMLWTLRGSAICEYTEVVCLDLACDETEERNLCKLSGGEGACSFITLLLMFAFLYYLGQIQDKEVEEIDVAEQTAQDYSIRVNDPDQDAYDPDEWATFFKQWGPVAYVTVALDNGPLIQALVRRRLIVKTLNEECESDKQFSRATEEVEEGQPLHPVSWKMQLLQAVGLKRDIIYWKNQLIKVWDEIDRLEKKEPAVVRVYVIFESEDSQRACLKALTTGAVQAFFECSRNIPHNEMFRGENVLSVNEAEEPEEVIWGHLHVPFWKRTAMFVLTMSLTLLVMLLVAIIIDSSMQVSTVLAAVLVSVFNGSLPKIITIITEFEQYPSQSQKQRSLLLKLVLARWTTTAFIIWYIQPFDQILSEKFISKVSAILLSDAFTTPLARVLDVPGRFKRHVISRIPQVVRTHAKMESLFTGTPYHLAERYTDMTKTLFVSLFYISLYPQGLFITSLAFSISFWADKYCLLRIWRTGAKVDASLTEVSRGHIALALIVSALITLHFYAGWPFDNLCPTDDYLTDAVASTFHINNTQVYTACSQEPHEWFLGVESDLSYMNVAQMRIVKMYSIFCFLCALFLGLVYFGKECFFSFRNLFFGVYKPVGDSQGISFSEVESGAFAYVPNILIPNDLHPYLACDISRVAPHHVGFNADYEKLNLNSKKDLPHLKTKERNRLFSTVKYYNQGAGQGFISKITEKIGLA